MGIAYNAVFPFQRLRGQPPVPQTFAVYQASLNGQNWGATAQTVQDLDADPSGNTIYATGTVNWRTVVNGEYVTKSANLSNRGTVYHVPDTFACLNQLILALAAIGSQNGVQ